MLICYSDAAQTLLRLCSDAVQMLSRCCLDAVQNAVQILFRYCSDAVQMLFRWCSNMHHWWCCCHLCSCLSEEQVSKKWFGIICSLLETPVGDRLIQEAQVTLHLSLSCQLNSIPWSEHHLSCDGLAGRTPGRCAWSVHAHVLLEPYITGCCLRALMLASATSFLASFIGFCVWHQLCTVKIVGYGIWLRKSRTSETVCWWPWRYTRKQQRSYDERYTPVLASQIVW